MIVKSAPWSNPWRVACLVAGAALSCGVIAQPNANSSRELARASSSSPTIAEALEAAWQRSFELAESAGRRRQAEAGQRVAGTWLAASPTVEALQREGRGSAAEGVRETELGIALPLWRRGQRQQNALAADADSAWAEAADRAARLHLLAQVREQSSLLRLADLDLQLASRQRESLEQLSADVDRRVRAGDLAAIDAMNAKADLLSARAREQEAQLSQVAQLAAWTLLTGLTQPPAAESSFSESAPSVDQHVEVVLADLALQRASARVAQVQAQRGGLPEVGVGVRQDRSGPGQPRQNSVALSLRLPLGSDAHNSPRLAAALAAEDQARANQQRIRRQVESELAMARARLAASQTQAEAQTERAALHRERTRLLARSFQAGESSLPDLLRALASTAEADAAAARQQASVAHARSRVQQALGQLP